MVTLLSGTYLTAIKSKASALTFLIFKKKDYFGKVNLSQVVSLTFSSSDIKDAPRREKTVDGVNPVELSFQIVNVFVIENEDNIYFRNQTKLLQVSNTFWTRPITLKILNNLSSVCFIRA